MKRCQSETFSILVLNVKNNAVRRTGIFTVNIHPPLDRAIQIFHLTKQKV